jgi:uncharacterized linocin/CFP29 family protein
MPDILKREHAPISEAAWSELDEQASDTLRGTLAGRKLVDFDGPHGWELAAVNLGTLKVSNKKGTADVSWGTREVLPLVEIRIGFTLPQMEVDNLVRGQKDVDLGPLEDAALKAARFEDDAIFNGFADGDIEGIAKATEHKAGKLPKDANAMPGAVSDALKTLTQSGVGGPYALVLGSDPFFDLKQAAKHGYPPKRAIEDMLEGPIIHSPAVKGGLVLSTRGEDFLLTVGKDLSIGYASHDRENVEFFLTESFTFRVIDPAAAVVLKAGS